MIGTSLWFVSKKCVELRSEVHSYALGPGECRVVGECSAISAGTERLLFQGEVEGNFDDSVGSAHDTLYPRKYGYSWVGKVAEIRPQSALRVGDLVFGLLPHATVHTVLESNLRVLPVRLPPSRAVLCANMETAINVVWDSRATLGDRVLVIGAGVVGLLVTRLLVSMGLRVDVVESAANRRTLAAAFGAHHVLAAADPCDENAYDVVIEATGQPISLNAAISAARQEARIIVASFYGARTHPIDLGVAFHRKRLSIVASQVSRIPPHRASMWDHDRRFAQVIESLGDSALDALTAKHVSFACAQQAYESLDEHPLVVFDYK